MSGFTDSIPALSYPPVIGLEFQLRGERLHSSYQGAVVDLGANVFDLLRDGLLRHANNRPYLPPQIELLEAASPVERGLPMAVPVLCCSYPGRAAPPEPLYWRVHPQELGRLRRANDAVLASTCVDGMYDALRGTRLFVPSTNAFIGGRIPTTRERAAAELGTIITDKGRAVPRTRQAYLRHISFAANAALAMVTGGPVVGKVWFFDGLRIVPAGTRAA